MKRIKNIGLLLILALFALVSNAQKKIDLFIWAGQSNAQGWMGDAAQYPSDVESLDESIKLNWTFFNNESSEGEWVKMQPQKGRFADGHFGPEVSCAREFKKAGYNPAIFKYTKGATGLARDWKAPGEGGIYDSMVKDLKPAIQQLKDLGYKVNIRGFIWIQGESDAGDERAARDYYRNLKELIHDLRNTVLHTPELKVILGVDEQHRFVQNRPIVVEAQKKLAQLDENIIYTTMYGLSKADATHLTPAGLVEHGKRIFEAYKVLDGPIHNEASEKSMAAHWQYIGIAVEEPGYTTWGTSPIMDEDGKVHLFVARWPGNKVEPGWRTCGEIAHYVGDAPEGPFRFSDLALTPTTEDTWDHVSVHNPAIHKVGEQYVLLYIGNNNGKQPPHPANQHIGMAVSKSLYGPWTKVGKDGKILSPPDNPNYWNYQATNGVNNPAFLQHPDGGFFLYFKSQGGKMGLAIAEKLEGPYVQLPFPVTQNNQAVEDGYAFLLDGQFCLLTTDNHGLIEKGGGILWKSEDGIHFTDKEQGFFPVEKYLGKEKLKHATNHYFGNIIKFERPQVLMIDGKPAYLYVPSGFHFFGGESPASYIMKYVE
ncbi:sialate O-acetylesterase [Sunxiuqinia rutila]|uniref:sialate O-acetylesterase n=1 Tax=Sunxiuqinia rutila TaxID=1397841 RepID=UPI003D369319